MRTDSYYRHQVRQAGRFMRKVILDFVSGIPRDEELIKTGISEFRPLRRIQARKEADKPGFHPRNRATSRKMNLAKEKKKEKSHET